jgi:hypothetical protein
MSLLNEIKSLLDKIEFPTYLEVYDKAMWYEKDGEVYLNSDQDLEDLLLGDGNTYSFEIKGHIYFQDDAQFFNVNDGCGETITLVLNVGNEIIVEDYLNYSEDRAAEEWFFSPNDGD